MDNLIIISDCSGSESSSSGVRTDRKIYQRVRRKKRLKRKTRYRPPPDTSTPFRASPDVIDLTGNGCALSDSDIDIIDLTGVETNKEMFLEISSTQEGFFRTEKMIKSEFACNHSCHHDTGDSNMEGTESSWCSCASSSGDQCKECSECCQHSFESSYTTVNSDMGSLESISDDLLEQDESSVVTTSDCPTYEGNCDTSIKDPIVLPDLSSDTSYPNRLTLDCASRCSKSPVTSEPAPVVSSSSKSPIKESVEKGDKGEGAVQAAPSNIAWLYKLRQYKNHPVHHLFFRRIKQEEGARKSLHVKPNPIPSRRMNILSSTVEECFPRGTLHFLSEFVSSHNYPPTVHQYPQIDPSILCHVIRHILLGADEQGLVNDAYATLMKVQELHPANMSTVSWDWNQLTEVMEKKEHPARLLFLQYVVQTLDDDFQVNVRRRSLQKCLAKTMLSCDKSFANIRDVIKWLIATVKKCSEIDRDEQCDCISVGNDNLRVIGLLQRMLSIAVEVDKSPTCSSNKIAEFMFSEIICITTRYQRELLFCSTESALLRAKVLEVMFHHSCEQHKTIPFSMGKILYFIEHSTLFLEEQRPGGEWQRWDEMLHHISLLFLSYQRIMSEHLLIPVTDRIDHILQATQPMTLGEDICEADVELQISNFKARTTTGEEIPQAFLDRLHMLRAMLCSAIRPS
ncbi:SUMO-interacting motif-containing protein 1 [Discoglossus pictus]